MNRTEANKPLTKQELKGLRDFTRRYISERGADPILARPITEFCRTPFDLEMLYIFCKKMGNEAKARGCAPKAPFSTVVSHERCAELLAEAQVEAEAQFPLAVA